MTGPHDVIVNPAAPPVEPPDGCEDPRLWALALRLKGEHGGTNGFCTECGDVSPCPGLTLAEQGLFASCGLETDDAAYWRDVWTTLHIGYVDRHGFVNTSAMQRDEAKAAKADRRSRRWWRMFIAFLVVAVLISVAANVASIFGVEVGRWAADRAKPAATPGVIAGEASMTGDELLRAIAVQLSDIPADTRTGTYEVLHDIVWGGTGGKVDAVDQWTWRTPDGLTYYAEQRRRDPALPAAGFELSKVSLDFSKVTPHIQRLTEEEGPTSPDLRLAASGDLVEQLTWYLRAMRQSDPGTPRVRVNDLTSVHMNQVVPTRLRAAILVALADLPDVEFAHRRGVDLRGRPGVLFTMHSGDATVMLLVDPVTGLLRATEERYGDVLFAYHLLDPPTWSDFVGPATPQPTPASTVVPTARPGVGKFSTKPTR
jgi:hypothetical protein